MGEEALQDGVGACVQDLIKSIPCDEVMEFLERAIDGVFTSGTCGRGSEHHGNLLLWCITYDRIRFKHKEVSV